MFERHLAKNGEVIGQTVLNIGLRVDAALVDRRIAAPRRPEPGPAVQGFDQLPASLRQRPGAAEGRHRRADDQRGRACCDPGTRKLQAGAGQERAPRTQQELILAGALASFAASRRNASTISQESAVAYVPSSANQRRQPKKANTRNGLCQLCAADAPVRRPWWRSWRLEIRAPRSGTPWARRSRGSGRTSPPAAPRLEAGVPFSGRALCRERRCRFPARRRRPDRGRRRRNP
jgi:hypothetical protein